MQVDARRDVGARLRTEYPARKGAERISVRGCVQNRSLAQAVNAVVLIIALLGADKKRGRFAERAVQSAIELEAVIGGKIAGERVAGVECIVVALGEKLPVQFVGAWLGENLDASVT